MFLMPARKMPNGIVARPATSGSAVPDSVKTPSPAGSPDASTTVSASSVPGPAFGGTTSVAFHAPGSSASPSLANEKQTSSSGDCTSAGASGAQTPAASEKPGAVPAMKERLCAAT